MVVPDVPINQTWQDSLDAWVLDMSCRGFSATTIRSRKSAGKVLARTLIDKGRLDPAEVTRSDMTSYVLARQQGSTGPEGAVTHYSNISSFWKWWTQDTEGAVNPLLKVAAPRAGQLTPPSVLTDDELERLLHACEGSTLESVRNTAIILTMASSGLRRAELAALVLDDVDLTARTLVVQHALTAMTRPATRRTAPGRPPTTPSPVRVAWTRSSAAGRSTGAPRSARSRAAARTGSGSRPAVAHRQRGNPDG